MKHSETSSNGPVADRVEPPDGDINLAALVGTLSSDPIERVLPSGDVVVTYELTCRLAGRKADSVPVSWFSPPKRRRSMASGDRVAVMGYVRRRFFRSGGVTASRTEVVASRVMAADAKAAATLAADMRSLSERVAPT